MSHAFMSVLKELVMCVHQRTIFPLFGKSIKFTERKIFVFPIGGVVVKLPSHFSNSSLRRLKPKQLIPLNTFTVGTWNVLLTNTHTQKRGETDYYRTQTIAYVWVISDCIVITAGLHILIMKICVTEYKLTITPLVCPFECQSWAILLRICLVFAV